MAPRLYSDNCQSSEGLNGVGTSLVTGSDDNVHRASCKSPHERPAIYRRSRNRYLGGTRGLGGSLLRLAAPAVGVHRNLGNRSALAELASDPHTFFKWDCSNSLHGGADSDRKSQSLIRELNLKMAPVDTELTPRPRCQHFNFVI